MRRLATTDRGSVGRWAWGVFLAVPAVGLFLAGKVSNGWVSITSFVLLFVYVCVGLGYGLVMDVRGWEEMEDEVEPGDGKGERDD